MTLFDDNPVWARAAALAACLCAAIEDPDNGVPGVCFCGVWPGAQVVAQYAGDCNDVCGMAWVRLSNYYPASGVGIINNQLGNCSAGMGIEFEVGILRCMSVGDEQGGGPTPEELTEAAQLQIADMQVMWQAILCCDAFDARSSIIGPYTPNGPQGGMVGGTILVATAV
jgi:hypothetical protein